MEEIVNDILENPKPYKWAFESGVATAFGAVYRGSTYLAGKQNNLQGYDEELSSFGMGLLAETVDIARESVDKSELFGYDDLAMITSGIYAGQKLTDKKFSDTLEDYGLDSPSDN